MKRLVVILLCVSVLLLASCFNGVSYADSDSDITVKNATTVTIYGVMVGTAWMQDLAPGETKSDKTNTVCARSITCITTTGTSIVMPISAAPVITPDPRYSYTITITETTIPPGPSFPGENIQLISTGNAAYEAAHNFLFTVVATKD